MSETLKQSISSTVEKILSMYFNPDLSLKEEDKIGTTLYTGQEIANYFSEGHSELHKQDDKTPIQEYNKLVFEALVEKLKDQYYILGNSKRDLLIIPRDGLVVNTWIAQSYYPNKDYANYTYVPYLKHKNKDEVIYLTVDKAKSKVFDASMGVTKELKQGFLAFTELKQAILYGRLFRDNQYPDYDVCFAPVDLNLFYRTFTLDIEANRIFTLTKKNPTLYILDVDEIPYKTNGVNTEFNYDSKEDWYLDILEKENVSFSVLVTPKFTSLSGEADANKLVDTIESSAKKISETLSNVCHIETLPYLSENTKHDKVFLIAWHSPPNHAKVLPDWIINETLPKIMRIMRISEYTFINGEQVLAAWEVLALVVQVYVHLVDKLKDIIEVSLPDEKEHLQLIVNTLNPAIVAKEIISFVKENPDLHKVSLREDFIPILIFKDVPTEYFTLKEEVETPRTFGKCILIAKTLEAVPYEELNKGEFLDKEYFQYIPKLYSTNYFSPFYQSVHPLFTKGETRKEIKEHLDKNEVKFALQNAKYGAGYNSYSYSIRPIDRRDIKNKYLIYKDDKGNLYLAPKHKKPGDNIVKFCTLN